MIGAYIACPGLLRKGKERLGTHKEVSVTQSTVWCEWTQAKELLDHSGAGRVREEILPWNLQGKGRLIDRHLDFRLDKSYMKMHFCCFKLPSLLFAIFCFVLLVKASQKINTCIIVSCRVEMSISKNEVRNLGGNMNIQGIVSLLSSYYYC